uniref:Protein RIC1 homolog n=1 Tax=Ixodes ricinus TaxID=34613 RepID=A0A147BDT3_IXORI
MYFPIRWPQILNIDRGASSSLVCVASDYNRSLFAVLGEDNISIWLEKLCVQIACHVQTPESLGKHGHNVKVVWKRDSSMLAILTTKGHLLLYDVIVDESSRPLFEQLDSSQATLKRESAELFVKDRVLPLKLAPSSHLSTSVDVASVLNFGDELLVACTSGCLLRVGWDASQRQELTLDLRDIPFASGGSSSSRPSGHGESLELKDVQYLPLLGALSVVFRNGRAAVVLSSSHEFESKDAHAVWIPDVTEAVVTAVNHRYRLVAFGLANGQGTVCYLDEASGQFAHSHRLALSAKDFPEAGTVAGPVGALRWTPDGAALFLAWSRGGFSLWSVFGSLLACSLNWEGAPQGGLSRVVSAEWGAEGYHLWMVASPSGEPQQREVMLMNFVKSASTVNPGPSGGGRHVLLQGADRVLVSSESDLADRDTLRSQDGSRGNKHWTVELVPHTYLAANWPIRYSAIDTECHHVAVAGRGGFAHCSLTHNKWKFFGNETQEQDFMVTGGLLWWQSLVVVGCINLRDGSDEVRLYPRSTKLDNMFVRVLRLEAQVLQLSLSEDRLLVFTADGRLALYRIHLGGLERLQELDLGGLVPHPLCVVSATLAHLGAAAKLGVLLNVCGRLVLLQQDPASSGTTPGGATPVGGTPRGGGRLAARHWSAPTVLAFCVERVWVADGRPDPRMPHLTQALWIACGVQGMQVWLPLFPPGGNPGGVRHAFMAKRIMLPIAVHIYPLAVLFEEAVVLGAESDTALCGSDTYPLCVVSKSSQVYLHPILRQLLCRNLGYHAWEIARSCAELPYFHHCLELLLHEVLEEEAMSSEPIPDALLPRVIDFIREFPVFLQTVVQCARKTELALWPHLFAAVGNPKDLFQECLLQGQLDTAASYLLVLQNLEVPLVSRQHATLLLGAALDGARWTLARDLVRFLRAIDPADTESAPPRSPTGPSTDEDTVNQVFMEVILSRHARKLLAAGQLRKLGSFAAHLDFPLEPFLEKERLRAARVDDFVVALKAVHTDFEWPLPQSVAASPTGSVASVGNEEAPPAQRNGPEAPGGGGTNAAVTRGSPADSESTSEESWWAEEEEVSAPVGVAEWRGPPQAEAQARHLLQALGKARCCDWALPLALMLGDSLVAPLVAPPGALDKLLLWASAECPGYLSLLRQVQGGRVLEEAPLGATSNGYPQRSPVHPRRVAVTSAPENPEDEGCRVA